MRRQCNERFGIAASERPCAVQRRNKIRCHRTRADRSIDKQFIGVAGLSNSLCQGGFDIGTKLRETFFF
jgi:hypothetical protein